MDKLMRIIKGKPFIIGVSAIIIYTLSGFFLVPWIIGHYVPRIVQDNFQKDATVGKVRFNPYIFTLETNDFSMSEPNGQPIAGFNRLFVDFELKSLFKWAWTFKQIAIEGPNLSAIISPDGKLNLADLVSPSDNPVDNTARKDKDKSLPRLVFEQIVITDGRIDFMDRRQSEPATVQLMPLNLDVENLSTLPDQEGSKNITVTSGDGETFQWTGSIDLNPVATKGTLKFENIQTATLWKFFRDSLNLQTPEGKISLTADYDVDLGGNEPKLTIDNFSGSLSGVLLKLAGARMPFLELPDTTLTGTGFDFIKQKGEIKNITISEGTARVEVDEMGSINLERIIKATGSRNSPSPKTAAGNNSETKPWNIILSAFNLDGFSMEYQDDSRSPGLKAGIDKIRVDLDAEAETGSKQTKLLVKDISLNLSGIFAGLENSPDHELLIDKITLDGGEYDLISNNLTIDKIAINGGSIDLLRQEDGAINLALLFRPPQKGLVAEELQEMDTAGRSINFLARTISVSNLKTTVSDRSVKPEGEIINIEDIALVLNNVDGKSPMTFDAGLKVREGGQLNAEGTIDPVKPSVQSEIKLTDFVLTPFQPYLDQAVVLELKSGTFSTQGTFKYGLEETGAQSEFSGGFKLENFRLLEPRGTETFLGWKSLQTDQLKLQLEPNKLEIGELKLAQLVGKFIIYEDSTINITKVIKTDPDSKPHAPESAERQDSSSESFPVVVRRLTMSDGRMEFADLSLTPQFGTRIHELKGVVAGISTQKNSRAQVKLDGRVDEYGTAKIDGELNTSDPKAFTNISMVFRNVEMTTLTPYSGRFAGRKIDSGKLSVDLNYDIQNSLLQGQNQIIVERLVLGERVKSPDAVNLPLDLAIALLEDSRGVIDIGLPVKGDLDSPEFSYGALIWKALTNLISKIVTSPFRALGALLPGGGDETMNIIVFEPGKSAIPPPEKEKLANLANALQKRPKLKLTVQGRFNPETDLIELRSKSLRRTLAIRQGQELKMDEDPGPVDYGNSEIIKLLKSMFKDNFGSDELKVIREEVKASEEKEDKSKTEDPGQLAKILFSKLIDNEPVGNPELVKLADARSKAILEELTTKGGLSMERIEIKGSDSLARKDPPTASLNLEVIK